MRVVRLIRAYQMYQAGETAGFKDDLAGRLIAEEIAVDAKAYEAAKADADAKAKADADAKAKADAANPSLNKG
jgi:hypothetical protein